jgi:hypothetical protein
VVKVEGDVIHMEEGAESAAARSQCTRASRGYYCYRIGKGDAEGGGQRTRSAQALEMRCSVSVGDNLALMAMEFLGGGGGGGGEGEVVTIIDGLESRVEQMTFAAAVPLAG